MKNNKESSRRVLPYLHLPDTFNMRRFLFVLLYCSVFNCMYSQTRLKLTAIEDIILLDSYPYLNAKIHHNEEFFIISRLENKNESMYIVCNDTVIGYIYEHFAPFKLNQKEKKSLNKDYQQCFQSEKIRIDKLLSEKENQRKENVLNEIIKNEGILTSLTENEVVHIRYPNNSSIDTNEFRIIAKENNSCIVIGDYFIGSTTLHNYISKDFFDLLPEVNNQSIQNLLENHKNSIKQYDSKLASDGSILSILDIRFSKDEVGLLEPYIKYRNNSEKTIKYVTFIIRYINAVNDVVCNEIDRLETSIRLKDTGPIEPFEIKSSGWHSDFYNTTAKEVQIFKPIKIEYMDGSFEYMDIDKNL